MKKTKYFISVLLPAQKQGFTLIELLVVIAIIGALAGVILVSASSARQKARDSKRIEHIDQIAQTMELYFNEHFGYPVASDVPIDTVTSLAPAFVGIIPKAPTPADDPVGSTICTSAGPGSCTTNNTYCYNGTVTTYTVTFCLGDKTGDLESGLRYLTPRGIQ